MSYFDQFATHHRSRRLPGYDYAAPGWYFVTICTHERRHLFGEIQRGVMGLNAIGCVAHKCLMTIPDHFLHAVVDACIVMPNHVHAVIGIGADDPRSVVAPLYITALRRRGQMSEMSPAASSLPTIVRTYKAAVTRAARHIRPSFGWQPRFHDHVIRNGRALDYIRRYVAANPATWSEDRLNTRCARPALSTPSSP